MNNHGTLIKAVVDGDIEEVKRLVEDRAVDSSEYPKNKEALCFAAEKTKNHRILIMQTLLEAKIGVDAAYDSMNNTPLMLAIMEFPDDLESIKLLKAKGASLTTKNIEKKTAIDIAREFREGPVLEILQPKDTRESFQSFIQMITALMVYVLAKVNEICGGVIGKLFDVQQPVDTEIAIVIEGNGSIDSVEDLKNSVNQTIQEYQLHKFFKDGNLLQTLAENAAKLAENPNTDLGKSPHVQKLITLSMYKPVIFCDDSGSMDDEDNRLQAQADIVRRISRITSYLIPDDMGIAVDFINTTVENSDNLREEGVSKLLEMIEPDGTTELGYNLRAKILKPMLYDKIQRKEELERPLLISIITDGCPDGLEEPEGNFVKVLKECRSILLEHDYPLRAVRFQISQVGSDPEATKFIDELRSERQLEKMIYCTTGRLDAKYDTLKENEKGLEEWLLTTLVGPIMECGNN